MNVTVTLDNRDWLTFNELLRIDDADFFVHGEKDKTPVQQYAYRILKARRALGMSMSRSDCCYNYVSADRFNVDTCTL